MIGLDTNIIVRLLVDDDAAQSQRVVDWLKNNSSIRDPHFISDLVLAETVWVLRRAYHFSHSDIAEALQSLFLNTVFKFERPDADMFEVLQSFSITGVDLSDILISTKAKETGCDQVITFDQRAIKHGIMDSI